jgi:hypothetical protein
MWRCQRQRAGVPRRRDAAEMRAPYAIVTLERFRAWLCRGGSNSAGPGGKTPTGSRLSPSLALVDLSSFGSGGAQNLAIGAIEYGVG